MFVKELVSGAAALVGGSLAGSYMSGAPFHDVATAVGGGAGAALGVVAVALALPKTNPGPGAIDATRVIAMGAASFAVVAFASGSLDTTSIAIAAGATISATLAEMFVVM